jgi:PAS domain S-box-containing protein
MRNTKALLVAASVLVALSAGTIVLAQRVRVPAAQADEYVLIAVLFSIALISVIVYRSLALSKETIDIATDLARDIAERFIASSQELSTEMYRSSPVPYVIVDGAGTIVSMNMSAVRLFGTTDSAMNGESIFARLASEEGERVAFMSEKLKASLATNDEELVLTRVDGTARYVLCSLFSFHDADGAQRGLLTLVDISKQKQIDKAKTEFVSLASHQLRTPIAAAKWNLELLRMKYGANISSEAQPYLASASGALEEMNLLVGDFLNASRFELGTLSPEIKTIDICALISDIYQSHKAKADAKKVTVLMTCDRELVSVASDPRLLGMIVNNLISNAIKYTPENGTVDVRMKADSGSMVLSVADTGMGIPREEQPRIFSKIFRASNAQASVPDGTGLGLYIAQEAARVLRGTIAFTSEEGKGTTFTATLPR